MPTCREVSVLLQVVTESTLRRIQRTERYVSVGHGVGSVARRTNIIAADLFWFVGPYLDRSSPSNPLFTFVRVAEYSRTRNDLADPKRTILEGTFNQRYT